MFFLIFKIEIKNRSKSKNTTLKIHIFTYLVEEIFEMYCFEKESEENEKRIYEKFCLLRFL